MARQKVTHKDKNDKAKKDKSKNIKDKKLPICIT
jgi:hypothetical protein